MALLFRAEAGVLLEAKSIGNQSVILWPIVDFPVIEIQQYYSESFHVINIDIYKSLHIRLHKYIFINIKANFSVISY